MRAVNSRWEVCVAIAVAMVVPVLENSMESSGSITPSSNSGQFLLSWLPLYYMIHRPASTVQSRAAKLISNRSGAGREPKVGNCYPEGVPRFYVENFGCRAARADGEAVSARLRAEGLDESGLSAADVVVINTCSVTAEADRDARAFVRKTQRANPAAKIVVTGCYAQRAPEEIAGLAGVSAVVGNSHKGLVPGIVHGLLEEVDSAAVSPGPALGR